MPKKLKKSKLKKVRNEKSTNVNKISIKIGNLPGDLGILGDSVSNFNRVPLSNQVKSSRDYGNQLRFSSQQANYAVPELRYIQAIPNYAVISGQKLGDNQGFGVSAIKAINPTGEPPYSSNPKDLQPINKSSLASSEVPKISPILNTLSSVPYLNGRPVSQSVFDKLHYEPNRTSFNVNKSEFMKPVTASSSIAQFIPRIDERGRLPGTFAEQGMNPNVFSPEFLHNARVSDEYANPEPLRKGVSNATRDVSTITDLEGQDIVLANHENRTLRRDLAFLKNQHEDLRQGRVGSIEKLSAF